MLSTFLSDFDRLVRIKFILGRAEHSYKRSKQNRGSEGLPPGKIVVTTPIRSLENAQFFGGFAV